MKLRHDYPTASPSVQLLWTLMLILICACATTILSAGLMACSGIPPEELLSFNTPRATAWLKGLQAVQTAGIFIGPVLLLMLLWLALHWERWDGRYFHHVRSRGC